MKVKPKANKHFFGSIATAKKAGISLRQLYHWVDHLRVVRVHFWRYGTRRFRRFTPEDIQKLKAMKKWVDAGYTLCAARARVKG